MDVRAGEKNVDARLGCRLQRAGCGNKVFFLSARQGTDARSLHFLGHLPDRGKVALGRDGKARFNDIDSKRFQLLGQSNFLCHVHTAAGRLFSVAEGRIEEKDLIQMHGIPSWVTKWKQPLFSYSSIN